MNPVQIDFGIAPGASLLVDTSAVLAYLSGAESTSAAAAAILDGMVASGRNPAAISAVTVTETLVRPFRTGSGQAVSLVEAFLEHFPNLRVEPVTFAVGRAAARIRATTSAPTPDALILATGVVSGASVAVANDARWVSVIKRAGLPIALIRLDEIARTGPAM